MNTHMNSGNLTGIYYDIGRAVRIIFDFAPIELGSLSSAMTPFYLIEDDTMDVYHPM